MWLWASFPIPIPLLLPSVGMFFSWLLFDGMVRSDPGRVTTTQISMQSVGVCVYCRKVQLAETRHCKVCNHCVDGFDHHCDVLGMCIGKGNMRIFLTFLIYHGVLCGYAFYVHIRMHMYALRNMGRSTLGPALLVASIVEAAFAGAFILFAGLHLIMLGCGVKTWHLVYKARGQSIEGNAHGD